eukprot:CAMPEP_0114425378 /NCGR_PEP_ID=MMETSP0103-20121206/7202_1 /TAXON_ID=37642 ORGANISM="Paraphysomonas imperforata, Strain PA2" /NCGR_SAMPLE_ID=MMETSP0103 /ASSEMBLY_ACC=CAM_ASM_000201 /LENGTH=202 /DNA_ID=CAMNT_0001594207 /DNA_START=625 /DNA_END=1229 /DNA_ORIENTATION=+
MEEMGIPLKSLKSQFITSVPMVEWAMSMRCSFRYNSCGRSVETLCKVAAQRGLLKVLQWSHQQHPPLRWGEDTCTKAAGGGHLEVLQWLRAQDPPCPWNEECCSLAAAGGSIDRREPVTVTQANIALAVALHFAVVFCSHRHPLAVRQLITSVHTFRQRSVVQKLGRAAGDFPVNPDLVLIVACVGVVVVLAAVVVRRDRHV